MAYYYLEVTRGIDMGLRYRLGEGALSIGRSSHNTIKLNNAEKSVSAHHAIVYYSPDRILIQDLQSTNGTFVNEDKVSERELAAGDVVGLGKMGPRLVLVASDTELPQQQPPQPAIMTGDNTRSKTIEDNRRVVRPPRPHTSTDVSLRPASRVPKLAAEPETGFGTPSGTMEMERKLMDKQASAQDMAALFRDGKRLEKIVGRGKLGETQENMLRSAFDANRAMRTKLLIVLGCVVVVALGVIVFFAGRAYQYRRLLDNGVALAHKLDQYERSIATLNTNPDANRDTLNHLIGQLETARNDLALVKMDLHDNDAAKFFGDPVERKIDAIMVRLGETAYHIPPEMTERVKYHIGMYSSNLKPVIQHYLRRRAIYLPMIMPLFQQRNLPQELAYVAMLESGFNPRALSHAGARGLWQFMPETGRRYGLVIDNSVDERLDPRKATKAATEYFKDLIAIFGGKSSVMLAMAAYNAGEGRVIGALRKIDDPVRNRDFWYIYRMGYLADETNEYIPSIIALMIISENPAEYGFETEAATDTAAAGLEAESDFVEVRLGSGASPQ